MTAVTEATSRMLPVIDRPLDNTAMAAYMTCPREFYHSMILHRRKEAESTALRYGTLWHKMLEAHYWSGGEKDAVQQAMLLNWPGDAEGDYRSFQRAFYDYDMYVKRWGKPSNEDSKTIGWPEAPMLEIASSTDGGVLPFPYTGKLDRLIEIQGMVYVEDHKTTSRLDSNFSKQFVVSSQMLGYAWLAQQLVPGKTVAGVRINVIHTLDRSTNFERILVSFSPQRIAEWVENMAVWMRRLASDQEFPGHYGDNGCSRKYGMCVYHEVCGTSARFRQRELEREFPINPWNPMEVGE